MLFWRLFNRVISKLFQLFFEIAAKVCVPKGRVLMFHEVGGKQDDEFNVSIEEFEKILQKLSELNVIRLEDWERSDNFYALTFDDVPESFYLNAYPLLLRYKIPFTVFISVSFLDTKGFVTTEQLKEIAASPLCTIGSHGMKHTPFKEFSKEEAVKDLSQSKQIISKIIGRDVSIYAYPFGSIGACSFKHKNLVNKNYRYGFGTVQCCITRPMLLPKYFLPRINVTSSSEI